MSMCSSRRASRACLALCALLVPLAAFALFPAASGAATCEISSNAAVIVGTDESDVICAGDGPNVIYGGLLDDEIYGGGGDDVIVGGHGTDFMHGQAGDDVLRGGTNRDCYVGGVGSDTASFATHTPSGSDGSGNPDLGGVRVDLNEEEPATNPPEPTCIGYDGQGIAFGEGYNEELVGIENLVGSIFDDDLEAANGGVNQIRGGWGDDVLRGRGGDDPLYGENGADQCRADGSAVSCTDAPEGPHRPAAPVAFLESHGPETGLVVLGREGVADDLLDISRPSSTEVRIDFDEDPVATSSCPQTGPLTLTCTTPSPPDYILAWGDRGADTITRDGTFPKVTSIDVNGGPGDDVLTGGPNGDVLFSGEGGADQLYGKGGTDALMSEGDPVGSGGDRLQGGSGNDQLVTDNACAGHTLWGGPDRDIIGFARQTRVGGIAAGVHAQLGEGSTPQQAWAIDPVDNEVAGCARSSILGGGEILEGTNQNDVLSGNGGANTLWARKGNDTLFGNGGNDTMYGHDGDDRITGGSGADRFYGGNNWDDLFAQDGVVDTVIDCGPGHDPGARRDGNDPAGVGCNDRVPTNAYLTLDGWLHGKPGYAWVSGNVQRTDGSPVTGNVNVNVNFQKYVNGVWTTMSTAHRALSNGAYDVNAWGVGVGQWRVRVVFPEQGRFARSTSNYHYFQIRSGYRLIARHSGKCMTLSGNTNQNGTAMIQWACSPAPHWSDGQVFSLVPMGGDEYQLQINSTSPRKCVDVAAASQADGAHVQAWDCLGAAQTNQIWRKVPIAGQPPYLAFIAKHSGKCADVAGKGTGDGARIIQWGCYWGANQQWTLQAVN